MNVRPGNLEIVVTVAWLSIGAYFGLEVGSLLMGVLAGVVFMLGFWGMFFLFISAANFALLPSYSRAPFAACAVAPFSTGITLLLLKGWPGVREVEK
ncbi:hypothetical protein ACI2KR_21475 [Pseudomonas luteola]